MKLRVTTVPNEEFVKHGKFPKWAQWNPDVIYWCIKIIQQKTCYFYVRLLFDLNNCGQRDRTTYMFNFVKYQYSKLNTMKISISPYLKAKTVVGTTELKEWPLFAMLVRFGEHHQIKANYIFKKINVKKFQVDLTAMHYVGYYTIKKIPYAIQITAPCCIQLVPI